MMASIPKTGRIFGIGLNKTGTTTLGQALNMLGIPTIDYPTDPRTLEQLERGDYRLDILETYTAVTDTPVGFFYPQLDRVYPGSKYILTVRDKDDWLRSARDHWPFVMKWCKHDEQFRRFTYYAFVSVYGAFEFDEARYSYVYDQYIEGVKRYFADRPDDLLVMDVCAGEGWEKLCPFLGLDIPDTPLPHLNRKEEKAVRQNWIDQLEMARLELDATVPADALLILIDEDTLAHSAIHTQRRTLPFTEANGKYNGPPADGSAAVAELERLRKQGAQYLAVAWQGFWWLDHYDEFNTALEETGPPLLDNERWKIFKLSSNAD